MENTLREIFQRLATLEANVKILMTVNFSGVGLILVYAGKKLLSNAFNGKPKKGGKK